MGKCDFTKNRKGCSYSGRIHVGNTKGNNNIKDILNRIAKGNNKYQKNKNEWYMMSVLFLILLEISKKLKD